MTVVGHRWRHKQYFGGLATDSGSALLYSNGIRAVCNTSQSLVIQYCLAMIEENQETASPKYR